MNVKIGLIVLTMVSVVADTMLLPFYPQFFSQEFNQSSPEHVGFYIAACSFTVMVTLPLWAKVAKRIHELHLWVYTQIASALLGVSCFFVESLVVFWVLSLTMLIFKASYLLIYPFVMRLEEKDKHLKVASLFSILMHFGAIGGALIGGVVLEFSSLRQVYWVMVGSDVLQVMVCLFMIKHLNVRFWQAFTEKSEAGRQQESPVPKDNMSRAQPKLLGEKKYIYTLGLVSLTFYLSAFLIRPFFTRHWEAIAPIDNNILMAFVYSIPAWIALIGLLVNHIRKNTRNHYWVILNALFFALVGVWVQSMDHPMLVVLGRCIFGWGLFQATVRLEVVLFECSREEDYAIDFSKIHLFQNIGVLIASVSVGSLVSNVSLQLPFWVSLSGFTLTTTLFLLFFRKHFSSITRSRKEVQTA